MLRLLDVALVPWMDQAFFDPLIQTLETVIREVPVALLRFRPDVSAVEAVRRDLTRWKAARWHPRPQEVILKGSIFLIGRDAHEYETC